MRFSFFLLIAFLCTYAYAQQQTPKNIIILIADGGGYNQMMCTDFFMYGDYPKSPLAAFPVQLAMSTYNGSLHSHGATCYDSKKFWTDFSYGMAGFTESAASATAMGTGFKTHNSMIGMNLDGNPMTNVIEIGKSKGKKTGVVTSVPFCHATPAGFSTHSKSRHGFSEITGQMLNSGILDVIGGSGHPYFDNDGNAVQKPFTKYIDTASWKNLKAGKVNIKWFYTESRSEIQTLADRKTAPEKLFMLAPVSGNLAEARDGHSIIPFDIPVKQSIPTLAEMSLAALNTLSTDPDGFILMIEGGAIDWADHDNNMPRMIEEYMYFYNTVDSVQRWLKEKGLLEETLIIVTNDHECGYLWGPGCAGSTFSLPQNNGKGSLPTFKYYSDNHSNTLVPFFAKGPSSEIFYALADENDSVRGPYLTNSEIAIAVKMLWGNAVEIYESSSSKKDSLTLFVTLPCADASIQWKANNTDISGANTVQFFIDPNVYTKPLSISCEVTCGQTTFTTQEYEYKP
ncbi:MAG: alkaline phosphatase [Bacteroidales bacterium]|jgi:alkaline phosphatase|nr:alkaline phosphatase [Bacteroidales bacterium]